jgi:hypothetical protein
LLYSTYRELVSFDEAKAFWDIIPNSTLAEREAKQEQERIVEGAKTSMLDDEAREWAEMSSNVGKTFKGEDGRWIPVIDEKPGPLSPKFGRRFSRGLKCGAFRYAKPPENSLNTVFQRRAGRRIRTDDLLITNQLLYQLSYAGILRPERPPSAAISVLTCIRNFLWDASWRT